MCERSGDIPWYRRPPAWIGSGMKSWPSVCIFISGVMPAVSPKSYAYTPLVSDGQLAGSTARIVTSMRPASFSRRNGNASPPKFEPPPVQPIEHVRRQADLGELRECLLADHGLVQQYVVEDAAERVVGVGVLGGHLDGLGDRDAQRAGGVGVLLQDAAAGLR